MLFSIITPVYQVEKYIHKCINSVLNQTYKDFEFILVDDGSKDNCPSIIDEYSKKDKRIKVIHKKNGGLVSARKAGIKQAIGDYIVILDSDDWIELDYLEKMENSLKINNADVVCCGYYSCKDNGEKKSIRPEFTEAWDREQIQTFCKNDLFKFPQTLWAKVMRRELYKQFQLKVNDIINMGEDGVVIYSMLPYCNCISFVSESLYNYRINESSMTHNKSKVYSADCVIERIDLLAKNLDLIEGIANQLSVYACHAYFNCCLSYFRNYRFKQAIFRLKSSYEYLSKNQYFNNRLVNASKYEKIARFLLKNKMFIIIRIIGDLRR